MAGDDYPLVPFLVIYLITAAAIRMVISMTTAGTTRDVTATSSVAETIGTVWIANMFVKK